MFSRSSQNQHAFIEINFRPIGRTLSLTFEPPLVGKTNGEALVEFLTAEDATRAIETRNKEYLGDRYVEIVRTQHQEIVPIEKDPLKAQVRLPGAIKHI